MRMNPPQGPTVFQDRFAWFVRLVLKVGFHCIPYLTLSNIRCYWNTVGGLKGQKLSTFTSTRGARERQPTRATVEVLMSTGQGDVHRMSVISRNGSSACTASNASNWGKRNNHTQKPISECSINFLTCSIWNRVGKKCYSCWTVISSATENGYRNLNWVTSKSRLLPKEFDSIHSQLHEVVHWLLSSLPPPTSHPHLRLKHWKHFQLSESRETAWPSLWLTQLCAKFTFPHTHLSITWPLPV